MEENLRSEYLMLQSQYEAFDARALTIKSWAAPLLLGGVALGVAENSLAVEMATIVAALSLWVLEGIWKNFQYCYIERIRLIENFFAGHEPAENIKAFQSFKSWGIEWSRHYHELGALISRMKQPFVFLPYLPVVLSAACAALYILRSSL
jgi:hypothetical protein